MRSAMPFIVARPEARAARVGYVASWDHTVGKGVISPHSRRYVVQNDAHARRPRPLPRHRAGADRRHGVAADGRLPPRRPRAAYESCSARYGLDPALPRRPGDGQHADERAVRGAVRRASRRLVAERAPTPASRCSSARTRATALAGALRRRARPPRRGTCRSRASRTWRRSRRCCSTATCVVANAGTILLDALVNDRPAVCVLYDEGAPAGGAGRRRT